MTEPTTKYNFPSTDLAVISEDISSLLRAAKAEILYPGKNGINPVDLSVQLDTIANSIEHTRMFDEMDPTDMSEFIDKNARVLADLHPSLLVRKMTTYFLSLPKL